MEAVEGEAAAPRARNPRRDNRRRCFNCGEAGHQTKECALPAGNTNCYGCGQSGHKASECPSATPAAIADSLETLAL